MFSCCLVASIRCGTKQKAGIQLFWAPPPSPKTHLQYRACYYCIHNGNC